jgi:hypothetical protein
MQHDNLRTMLKRDTFQEFAPKQQPAEAADEYEAFASGRIGLKPQVSVTFEKANGSSITLAYAHLYSISTESANAGFLLEFSEHRVLITGRNLEKLYRYLGDHRARHVLQTAANQSFGMPDDQPVVEILQILESKDQEKSKK